MEVINAIGRRKSAVARVYLTEGTGSYEVKPRFASNSHFFFI
jgi:ribosomal protein S9